MSTADTLARLEAALREYAAEAGVAIHEAVEGPGTIGLADRIVATLGVTPTQWSGVVSDRPWIQIHDIATQFRLITTDPDCDPALMVAVTKHQLKQTPNALTGDSAWAAGIDEIEEAINAVNVALDLGPIPRGGEQLNTPDAGLSIILRSRPYFALVAESIEMGSRQPHLPAVETVSVVVEHVLEKALRRLDGR